VSQKDRKLDDALDGVDAQRRATLTRLIAGTSFVAPMVVSSAMQGLAISTADAFPANSSGAPV